MTPALVDPYWLHRAAHTPDVAGAATASFAGDETACGAVWDYACEHWEANMVPLSEGESYLICTQTLYYIGRVRAVVGGFVVLEDTSWVHWTGRLSTLLSKYKFSGFPTGDRKPRTERLGRDGEATVALGAIVSFFPWRGDLPKESVT